mgnify:CR=1 FL=1
MLLKKYGHCSIEYGGVKYVVIPSFINISKIGEPTDIVEAIKGLHSSDPLDVYCSAFSILQSCCDLDFPPELFGDLSMTDDGINKLDVSPEQINDLIVLASHCVKHGIIGDVESKGESGDPLVEFDAYEYIDLAVEHFNLSYDEAAKMTMTQFVRRMHTKYPETHKRLKENERDIDGRSYTKFNAAAEAAQKQAELKNNG